MEADETGLSPELKQQLDTLMRGTFFADEVDAESPQSNADMAETAAAAGGMEPPSGGRNLRAQMRRELAERLAAGRPLRVYLGVDPTARSLHIGHLVPVLKLRQFQDFGHRVVFLIGDYTGLIGDPSGRSQARKQLDADTLRRLSEGYAEQVFKILDPQKTEVRRNSEWLEELRFSDIIRLAAQFPLKQVVARRDFQQRMEKGESLRFHEALYALMQGYDAYALECDVQVGGYDQYFNLLAGRVIQQSFGQKPHVMVTLPLLPGTDGRKMSKSYKNAINVTDSASDIYGKVMRIDDTLIESYLEHACLLSPQEVDALEAGLRGGQADPMAVKKKLAFAVTRLYHGAQGAVAGQAAFERISQRRQAPPKEQIPLYEVDGALLAAGVTWPDMMVKLGLMDSKGAVKRLMQGGGFKVAGEPLRNREAGVGDALRDGGETLIQFGKRKYARLRVVSNHATEMGDD
jgi:tyrosyl-tRNA synthetase